MACARICSDVTIMHGIIAWIFISIRIVNDKLLVQWFPVVMGCSHMTLLGPTGAVMHYWPLAQRIGQVEAIDTKWLTWYPCWGKNVGSIVKPVQRTHDVKLSWQKLIEKIKADWCPVYGLQITNLKYHSTWNHKMYHINHWLCQNQKLI